MGRLNSKLFFSLIWSGIRQCYLPPSIPCPLPALSDRTAVTPLNVSRTHGSSARACLRTVSKWAQFLEHIFEKEAAYPLHPLLTVRTEMLTVYLWARFYHADVDNIQGDVGATQRKGSDPWVTSLDRDADQLEYTSASEQMQKRDVNFCFFFFFQQLSLYPNKFRGISKYQCLLASSLL